jgi:hypothetical protein
MENITPLPVDPYNHLKFFFGEKFMVISLKEDSSVSCCIGADLGIQDMTYLLQLLNLVVDSHIHQTTEPI